MTEHGCQLPAVLDDEAAGNPRIAGLVHALLTELGEAPEREGLLKTPSRVARSWEFLTSGYGVNIKDVVNGALFTHEGEGMILERDINFFSTCEHHMLPFYGVCHVAYIPNGKIIGLSKIARIVDVFARRLQVQERMTGQIADALMECLDPHGVAVTVEGRHLCMVVRGVQKPDSKTLTSALRGRFQEDHHVRSEFFELLRR